MGTEIITGDDSLGPAMRALTGKQQAFVRAMLDKPGLFNTEAVVLAGYETKNPASIRTMAHELAHNPKIQEAMHEEGLKRLNSGSIAAVSTVLEIMTDTTAKSRDRLTAAEMVMNRTGFHAKTEHNVNVKHSTDDAGMIARIKHLASSLGLDAKKLLGSAGVVVDAEFEEVATGTEGLEDLL